MADSFFSMLKNERVCRTVYATKAQARKARIQYIEGSYNSRRPNEVHHGYHQPTLAAEKKPLIPLLEIPVAAQKSSRRSCGYASNWLVIGPP